MKMKRNSFRATFREIFIAIFVVICILFVGLVFFNKSDQKQPTQTVVQEGPRELTVYGIAGILDVLREIGWPDPMDLVGVLCDTIEVDSLTFWLVRIDMDNEDALGSSYLRTFCTPGKEEFNFNSEFLDIYWRDGTKGWPRGWVPAGPEKKIRKYWPAIQKYGRKKGLDMFNPSWWYN